MTKKEEEKEEAKKEEPKQEDKKDTKKEEPKQEDKPIKTLNPKVDEIAEIKNDLEQKDKKLIFNFLVKNLIFDYKKKIEETKCSVLEDLSSKNSRWTSVHFAFYHGTVDIIRYCLDRLLSDEILEDSIARY